MRGYQSLIIRLRNFRSKGRGDQLRCTGWKGCRVRRGPRLWPVQNSQQGHQGAALGAGACLWDEGEEVGKVLCSCLYGEGSHKAPMIPFFWSRLFMCNMGQLHPWQEALPLLPGLLRDLLRGSLPLPWVSPGSSSLKEQNDLPHEGNEEYSRDWSRGIT